MLAIKKYGLRVKSCSTGPLYETVMQKNQSFNAKNWPWKSNEHQYWDVNHIKNLSFEIKSALNSSQMFINWKFITSNYFLKAFHDITKYAKKVMFRGKNIPSLHENIFNSIFIVYFFLP